MKQPRAKYEALFMPNWPVSLDSMVITIFSHLFRGVRSTGLHLVAYSPSLAR